MAMTTGLYDAFPGGSDGQSVQVSPTVVSRATTRPRPNVLAT